MFYLSNSPKARDIQFIIMYDEEKQQNKRFENIWHFCIKNMQMINLLFSYKSTNWLIVLALLWLWIPKVNSNKSMKLYMNEGRKNLETFALYLTSLCLKKIKKSKCSFKAADSWLKLRPSVATKSWLSWLHAALINGRGCGWVVDMDLPITTLQHCKWLQLLWSVLSWQ